MHLYFLSMTYESIRWKPLFSIIILIIVWGIYVFEYTTNTNLNFYGIKPGEIIGLRGVVFAPMIHGSMRHLVNNSLAFFILCNMLISFYDKLGYRIFVLIYFFSGTLTWFFAQNNYHIGLSGVIYGVFGFLITSGLIRKNYRLLAVSLTVVFWYGSMFWYVFPIEEGISWEGHLSGLIVGLVLALVYRRNGPAPIEHIYEKTEFDDYFDEAGYLRDSLSDDLIQKDATGNRDI